METKIESIIGIIKELYIFRKSRPKCSCLMSSKTLCIRAELRKNGYLWQKCEQYIIKTIIICLMVTFINFTITRVAQYFCNTSTVNNDFIEIIYVGALEIFRVIIAIIHFIILLCLHVNFKGNINGYRISYIGKSNKSVNVFYEIKYDIIPAFLVVLFAFFNYIITPKYQCMDSIFREKIKEKLETPVTELQIMIFELVLILLALIILALCLIVIYILIKIFIAGITKKKNLVLKINIINSKKLVPKEDDVDGKDGLVLKKRGRLAETPINLFESNISIVEDGHILIEYKTGDSEIIDKKDIEYIAVYKGKNRNFEIVYKDNEWIQQPKNDNKNADESKQIEKGIQK